MAYSVKIPRDAWAPLAPGWTSVVLPINAGEGWIVEVPTWAKWARVRGTIDPLNATLLAVSPKILDVIDPTQLPPAVFCTGYLDAQIPIITGAFTVASFGSNAYYTIEIFSTDACPWNR